MSRASFLSSSFFQCDFYHVMKPKIPSTCVLVHKCNCCFSLRTPASPSSSSSYTPAANTGLQTFLKMSSWGWEESHRQKWLQDRVRLTNLTATLHLQRQHSMKAFISLLLSFTCCVWDKTDKQIPIKKTNKSKRLSVSPRDEFDLKPCATVSLKKRKKEACESTNNSLSNTGQLHRDSS